MNNEKKIKNRIQITIVLPIILALILLGVSIYINGLDTKIGVISVVLLVVYLLIAIIMYFRLSPYYSSVLVEYSLEQGKIQKELLYEMEIPYAILDLSGHVMWSNNMFHDILGISRSKRIRKSVDTYFPEIVPELLDGTESVDINIEYDERKYRVSIKRVDLSKVFNEEDISIIEDFISAK